MKRTISILLIACIICSLSACYTKITEPIPHETTQVDPTGSTKKPVPQMAMASISLPVTTEATLSADNKEIFHYTYQSISLTLPDPDVAEKVILDFLTNVDATRSAADSIKTAAEADCKHPNNQTPYLCQILFDPMRIDQNILSLFGNFVTYQGLSHPESTQLSSTYDLTTGKKLTLSDILTDSSTADALTELLVNALAGKAGLYPDYEETVKHRIFLNFKHDTAWYLSTDGLCFYFAPYDIAPYSSGVIHATIPYKNLTGILDDAYFPVELEPADGNINVSNFNKQSIVQYTQICEISVGGSSEKCLLSTDRAVYNLRISVSDNLHTENIQTVFFAQSLTPGDAVVIQGFEPDTNGIQITFESNEQTVEYVLRYDALKQSYSLQPRV